MIGMTGASGSLLAARLLESTRECEVETHLVISEWAQRTLQHETSFKVKDVQDLATRHHANGNMGAAISSRSFVTNGMVVVPSGHKACPMLGRRHTWWQ